MIYEEEYMEEMEPDVEDETVMDDFAEKDSSKVQIIGKAPYEEEDQNFSIGEGILQSKTVKTPPSLNNISQESASAKNVRVGGFFGQKVTIKTKDSNGNLLSSANGAIVSNAEGSTQVQVKVSITKLRPPRKITIKLCQICGNTLRGTSNCSKCGFKN
jgi:hypothetical protein